MAIQDSSGIYSRTVEAGPLIIPNYVMANQKFRQSSYNKSSAESLVEKVWKLINTGKYPTAFKQVLWSI